MNNEGKILIIDDNEEFLVAYEVFLSRHFKTVKTLADPDRIPSLLDKSEFDVILLDMNFSAGIHSGNEGFFWMNRILAADKDATIILITAFGDIDLAIRAIREGASDFILKSWDKEKILSTILSAYQLRMSRLEIRNLKTKQQHLIENEKREFDLCRGSSVQMTEIWKTVEKVAPTDANILILGENGTGKEILAREIHSQSKRRDEIFVPIDVGSISENLFESELFGHVKGAFTDAVGNRPGRIEIASGGTLFLDEIGNLPLSLQAKLLSVLEKREVTRVGASQATPVNIRLICATNSNLYQLCEEGRFREDLMYRINNIQFELPPLRERPEDIPQLVRYFIDKFTSKYNKPGIKISNHALRQLSKNYWKGNIRELRNRVEKAVLLSEESLLKPSDFESNQVNHDPGNETAGYSLESNERNLILKALKRTGNNKKMTARILGINRTTLYNKMKKYGIGQV